MREKLLLAICTVYAFASFAQMTPGITYQKIITGPSPSGINNPMFPDLNRNLSTKNISDFVLMDKLIQSEERYNFDKFVDGYLIYTSGNRSRIVKMNYDQLFGEMRFIDEKEDTLFVTNSDTILYVRLEEDLFYHNAEIGYLKIHTGNDVVKLTSNVKIKVIKQNNMKGNSADLPKYLVDKKSESFYLVNQEKTIYAASKVGFKRSFPKHKHQIDMYLTQMARQKQPIKFNNKSDVEMLMKFAVGLQ
jgi:hypothetical protein